MSTWLDRPLSIAGRAIAADGRNIMEYLVNADKDLVVIPNLAIHMDRKINDGYSFNAQKDMLPLFGDEAASGKFDEYIKKLIGIKELESYDISTDLFLYNREKGTIWGYNDEFISAPRLDDIQCAYSSVKAFTEAYINRNEKKEKMIPALMSAAYLTTRRLEAQHNRVQIPLFYQMYLNV